MRENCRHAQITFDKFHVIGQRSGRRSLPQRTAPRHERSERSTWLWRKNPKTSDEQQLDTLDQELLQTAQAYQMKLQLQNLYQSPYRSWAKRGLQAWCRRAQKMAQTSWRGLLKPIGKLANMIEKHLEGILAHWESHVTNAYMEALNSVFSATKRKARGYRTTENLITMILRRWQTKHPLRNVPLKTSRNHKRAHKILIPRMLWWFLAVSFVHSLRQSVLLSTFIVRLPKGKEIPWTPSISCVPFCWIARFLWSVCSAVRHSEKRILPRNGSRKFVRKAG